MTLKTLEKDRHRPLGSSRHAYVPGTPARTATTAQMTLDVTRQSQL